MHNDVNNARIRMKAELIISAITGELELGTRHFNKQGKLLTTTREILETLMEEKQVTIEPIQSRKWLYQEH